MLCGKWLRPGRARWLPGSTLQLSWTLGCGQGSGSQWAENFSYKDNVYGKHSKIVIWLHADITNLPVGWGTFLPDWWRWGHLGQPGCWSIWGRTTASQGAQAVVHTSPVSLSPQPKSLIYVWYIKFISTWPVTICPKYKFISIIWFLIG